MQRPHRRCQATVSVLTTALATVFAVQAACAQSTAPVVPARSAITGHLRSVGDVDVLFLHGSLEQRGFTEGYLTAERIVALFRNFSLSKQIIPNARLWDLVILPRLKNALELPDWVRPRAEAIVRGIAARDPALLRVPELGRDLTAADVIAGAVLPDLVGLRCSSFVAWGDRTAGDGPVVGRNLDYFSTPALLEHTMVIVHAPRGDRAGWVSIGWPGVLGCLTGLSDQGVSVAIHDVPARAERGEKITPRAVALQELVERLTPGARPADSAAAILREFRYGMGGNFMVGWNLATDAGPIIGGAVYELFPAEEKVDGVTTRLPPDGQTFITCSNHHRARVEPSRCWRYDALFGGVLGADAGVLDFDAGWDLIGRSEVDGTLYQTVVDLSDGSLGVRLRRTRGADAWTVARDWKVRDLLDEAADGSTEANGEKTLVPVRSGR